MLLAENSAQLQENRCLHISRAQLAIQAPACTAYIALCGVGDRNIQGEQAFPCYAIAANSHGGAGLKEREGPFWLPSAV